MNTLTTSVLHGHRTPPLEEEISWTCCPVDKHCDGPPSNFFEPLRRHWPPPKTSPDTNVMDVLPSQQLLRIIRLTRPENGGTSDHIYNWILFLKPLEERKKNMTGSFLGIPACKEIFNMSSKYWFCSSALSKLKLPCRHPLDVPKLWLFSGHMRITSGSSFHYGLLLENDIFSSQFAPQFWSLTA